MDISALLKFVFEDHWIFATLLAPGYCFWVACFRGEYAWAVVAGLLKAFGNVHKANQEGRIVRAVAKVLDGLRVEVINRVGTLHPRP